ncbi:5 -nucleotidase isoform X1 [Pelobates cultripes]|uniref:5'-nucleotidase n=1 Tax=Pelobates cultripes TaxID=61616 RepID=A0AAD1RD75_PELCU|nr:5 -nucleotidase isoform X1 [Pelobates cultripes]
MKMQLLLHALLCSFPCTLAVSFQVTLLHTNDVHARVEQTNRDSGKCGNPSECYAGVARRFTKIQEIRNSHEHVLLLDAGDQYQGTIWFNYFKGEEAAYFMNYLHYDAMRLANNASEYGVFSLLHPSLLSSAERKFSGLLVEIARDRLLACARPCMSRRSMPVHIIKGLPTQIKLHISGERKISMLRDKLPKDSYYSGMFKLFNLVGKLQTCLTVEVEGVTIVGCAAFEKLSLVSEPLAAAKVRTPFSIEKASMNDPIGGEVKRLLSFTGPPPSNDVPVGEYPFIVKSDDGRSVPVVQAYAFGKYLGFLTVTFDEAGNVLQSSGNPILLDSSIPEDPALLVEINKWKEQLTNFSSFELGKTLVFLNGSSVECRYRECNLGNLICDAMIDNNLRYPDELMWNHVSLCIINSGGIRGSIDERNSNGSITLEELLSVLPFGGTFDLIEVKGSTLKAVFEHSVHRYGGGTGEFLQVGGIKVVYNIDKAPGQRVVKLEVICTRCRVPRYVPVEMDQTYKIVLPAFLATGGDGFSMLINETLKHDSGDLDVAVVSRYINKMLRVHPAVEGRIQFSNENSCSGSQHSAPTSFASVIVLSLFALLQNMLSNSLL